MQKDVSEGVGKPPGEHLPACHVHYLDEGGRHQRQWEGEWTDSRDTPPYSFTFTQDGASLTGTVAARRRGPADPRWEGERRQGHVRGGAEGWGAGNDGEL